MLDPDTVLQSRYKIVRPIGKGGMGAVYLAVDQRLGHTVALKESFFEDDYLRKAFEREARLLAGLRHTALPRVSDHFTEGNGQFLVMEFIPGDDMADLLAQRGQAFPQTDVLGWADQLLDALDYIHTQEPPIIHRDIKPQNLKLTGRNQIILLDFGLAKGAAAGMTRVSSMGSVFGYTATYASLEQIQGAGTDPRSDLYSLGATLYHLLTNAAPVDALTRATASVNGDPDPLRPAHELNRAITPQVSAVVQQALALKRNDRPASAAELRQSLRVAAQAESSRPAPANSLASTVMFQPPAPSTPKTSAPSSAPPSAPVSGPTTPPPSLTAPQAPTAHDNRQPTSPAPKVSPSTPQATPQSTQPAPSVTQPTAQATQPPQPARRSRTVLWIAAGLGLALILGVVAFVGLAIFVASSQEQQQTTSANPANTSPASSNSSDVKNSNRAVTESKNNEQPDTAQTSDTYNSSPADVSAPNLSDVHVNSIYMTDTPDGEATTAFSPADHTVYAVVKLNKIAEGTQVRFTWIAENVAGERQDSKIRDVDYTMGADENIVKAHLTLPQDWPVGQYKVAVYINGGLEQTIDYTVE